MATKLYPKFTLRNLVTPLKPPAGRYQVTHLAWNVLGGPDSCDIEVTGDPATLMAWLFNLRAGVTIQDRYGRPWWWGYISNVTVRFGSVELSTTLEGMANRVRVLYGSGSTTTWATDNASVTTYGQMDRAESFGDVTAEVAAQRRDIILAALKLPLTQGPNIGSGGGATATLSCAGWWKTLDWRYYSKTAYQFKTTECTDPSNALYRIIGWNAFHLLGSYGETVATYSTGMLAHTAVLNQSAEAWTLKSIDLNMQWFVNGGNQGLYGFHIYIVPYDAVGYPPVDAGHPLLDNAISSGAVATTFVGDWKTFEMSAVTITPGTAYWIILVIDGQGYLTSWVFLGHRTPPVVGSTDYYQVDSGDYGYGWQACTSPVDGYGNPYEGLDWGQFDLRANGVLEHTAQMGQIIAASEFLIGTDIADLSNILDSVKRDGSQRQLQILEELLSAGTTNNRRLLASVMPDRRLRVYEEPAKSRSSVRAWLNLKGELVDAAGNPLTGDPTGAWCSLVGVPIPENAAVDPTLFFVERAELDVASGRWTVEPRGMDNPWMLGAIA